MPVRNDRPQPVSSCIARTLPTRSVQSNSHCPAGVWRKEVSLIPSVGPCAGIFRRINPSKPLVLIENKINSSIVQKNISPKLNPFLELTCKLVVVVDSRAPRGLRYPDSDTAGVTSEIYQIIRLDYRQWLTRARPAGSDIQTRIRWVSHPRPIRSSDKIIDIIRASILHARLGYHGSREDIIG